MLKRTVATILCAAALAACGPAAAPEGAEGDADAQVAEAAAPVVSTTECVVSYDRPHAPDELPIAASEPDGWMLRAEVGVLTCGPVANHAVTCQARPGSVFFALQDYWWYDIPAGRTATVSISETGSPSCFLNEAG